MALALLLIGGCDKQPVRFPVAAPGPQTLPTEPATGTHYAQSAWATVHRDSGNTDYVPLRVSTAGCTPGRRFGIVATKLRGLT